MCARCEQRLAVFSAEAEAQRLEEKKYLYDTLYTCRELELEHKKAGEVVTELFEFWVSEPEELPEVVFRRGGERGAGARGGGLYCGHDGQFHSAAVCGCAAEGAGGRG